MDKYYKLLDMYGSLDSLFADIGIDAVDILAALDDARFIDVDELIIEGTYEEDDDETSQYTR